MEHLVAYAPATAPDVSQRLDRWLSRSVGASTTGEPLPSAAWRLSDEPASSDAAEIGDAGAPALVGDARAICALQRLAAALPACRFVVFVESPLAAMIGWATDPRATAIDMERRLDGWRRGASTVLDLLPELGQRLLLISIDDVDEVAGAALGAGRLRLSGKPSAAKPLDPPANADPLLVQVLDGWVARDASEVLYGRLLAACEPPLPADPIPAEGTAPQDRSAAIAALRDVHAARAELSRQATPAGPGATGGGRRPTLLEAAQALPETRKLRHDNELLNSFLQQMQEELESSRGTAVRSGASSSSAYAQGTAAVAFGHEALEAPHRHVDFSVRYERLERGTADLAGRLVEHHGRAGLLLFAESGSRALDRWTESGDEGGRGFMLLIPGVASCAALIDALPASDLQLWLRLAADVREALRDDVPMLQSAYWYAVASAVHDQLSDAASRLHWDAAEVTLDDGGQAQRGLQLSIPRISLGDRVEGPLLLCWRASPGAGSVELLRRPQAGRPWPASWPVEPHGAVAAKWPLPVGTGLDAARKRDAWKRISPTDRACLIALLDALPAITSQGRSVDGRPIVLSAGETAALHRLAQEAREHTLPPRKSWARRLLARMRPQRKRKP